MNTNENKESRVIIVGIAERGSEVDECNVSLDELSRLVDTAGGEVVARVLQIKESFDPRTCIGSGKVKEIAELKMPDLNAASIESAMSMIAGAARSMGVEVVD